MIIKISNTILNFKVVNKEEKRIIDCLNH